MHELMTFERKDLLIPTKERAQTEQFTNDPDQLSI